LNRWHAIKTTKGSFVAFLQRESLLDQALQRWEEPTVAISKSFGEIDHHATA
jgi:hypothetical protein